MGEGAKEEVGKTSERKEWEKGGRQKLEGDDGRRRRR
jgi:hypothetical protein